MDIVGLGTEIVDCARVRGMIEEHKELFLTRVYSPEEIHWCQSRAQTTEQFAAVWAAKEAVCKALGIGKRTGTPWSQIRIHLEGTSPRVELHGRLRERMMEAGISGFQLTTAFCRQYATATAIAVRAT